MLYTLFAPSVFGMVITCGIITTVRKCKFYYFFWRYNMNKPETVYQGGVIAVIEQFCYNWQAYPELTLYVVYTYYDTNGQPLYVGASKDFFNTHYFNSKRLKFFNDVKYVGLVFADDEAEMKDMKRYYTRARQPRYAKTLYSNLPIRPDLDSLELVVSETEMSKRWREFLSKEPDTKWSADREYIGPKPSIANR